MKISKIIISRTDSIGDVVLTLPMAGVLKELYPDCEIVFLGRNYTKPVIDACKNIDSFLNWDDIKDKSDDLIINKLKSLNADVIIHVFPNKRLAKLAKKANIKQRIGTSHRVYHWWTCNKLLNLGRKNSPYHEAQLNIMLLNPLGVKKIYELNEIPNYYGLTKLKPLSDEIKSMLPNDKFNLVLHPKSKGSAVEWGVDNFAKLIEILPQDKFRIFISGTSEERKFIEKDIILKYPHIIDLTGKLNLDELISFLSLADGIVAASTGPLHIGAALGINALGLYSSVRPIHPLRWAPLGRKSTYFTADTAKIKKGSATNILNISPTIVKEKLLKL